MTQRPPPASLPIPWPQRPANTRVVDGWRRLAQWYGSWPREHERSMQGGREQQAWQDTLAGAKRPPHPTCSPAPRSTPDMTTLSPSQKMSRHSTGSADCAMPSTAASRVTALSIAFPNAATNDTTAAWMTNPHASPASAKRRAPSPSPPPSALLTHVLTADPMPHGTMYTLGTKHDKCEKCERP
eukprot:363346-Chlamydomonas_euryale.AAC.2